MSSSERDASPVRVAVNRRTIHAVVKPELYDDLFLIQIKAKEMTDREFQIIMAWAQSPCITEDYLHEIDENGKPVKEKFKSGPAWVPTPGLELVPTSRDAYLEHMQVFNNFFAFDMDESICDVHCDKPVVTLLLRF